MTTLRPLLFLGGLSIIKRVDSKLNEEERNVCEDESRGANNIGHRKLRWPLSIIGFIVKTTIISGSWKASDMYPVRLPQHVNCLLSNLAWYLILNDIAYLLMHTS
jgi:hypothetical protein